MTRLGMSDSVRIRVESKKNGGPYSKISLCNNTPTCLNTVRLKGGKLEKEKALFDNLREYVKDPWKDELCPNPEIFKDPVREKQHCPDWI